MVIIGRCSPHPQARSVTGVGIYARALVVRASRTGAPELAKSMAEDLIARAGLRAILACRTGRARRQRPRGPAVARQGSPLGDWRGFLFGFRYSPGSVDAPHPPPQVLTLLDFPFAPCPAPAGHFLDQRSFLRATTSCG